jgi:cold shock CspA family protein
MKGHVAWWNVDRGYGCLAADELNTEIFAHRNDFLDIPIDSALIENEPVEFEIGDVQGRLQAVSIRRLLSDLNERFEGIVKNFDRKRGTGWILREDEADIFVHWSDVVDQRKIKFLAPEEEVEFSIGYDDGGRNRAIFVTHDTRPVLLQFAELNDFKKHLAALAHLAEPEPWTFDSNDPNDTSLLNHCILSIFRRARFETRRLEREKLVIRNQNSDQRQACFNTGLVTPFEEPIFGYFISNRSREATAPRWWLEDFCVRSDLKLSGFDKLPDRVSFVGRPAELIFDWRRDLRLRKDHISSRLERLNPEVLTELSRRDVSVMEAVDLAKDEALRRVHRDYKIAVPQFYRGEVQLLLPLCITSGERADVALVVEKHDEAYFGNTILTLEQAYFNARLIARPDAAWLQPALDQTIDKSGVQTVEMDEETETLNLADIDRTDCIEDAGTSIKSEIQPEDEALVLPNPEQA